MQSIYYAKSQIRSENSIIIIISIYIYYRYNILSKIREHNFDGDLGLI